MTRHRSNQSNLPNDRAAVTAAIRHMSSDTRAVGDAIVPCLIALHVHRNLTQINRLISALAENNRKADLRDVLRISTTYAPLRVVNESADKHAPERWRTARLAFRRHTAADGWRLEELRDDMGNSRNFRRLAASLRGGAATRSEAPLSRKLTAVLKAAERRGAPKALLDHLKAALRAAVALENEESRAAA